MQTSDPFYFLLDIYRTSCPLADLSSSSLYLLLSSSRLFPFNSFVHCILRVLQKIIHLSCPLTLLSPFFPPLLIFYTMASDIFVLSPLSSFHATFCTSCYSFSQLLFSAALSALAGLSQAETFAFPQALQTASSRLFYQTLYNSFSWCKYEL